MSFGLGAVQPSRGSAISLASRPDPKPGNRRVRIIPAGIGGERRLSICTADELHFVSVPSSDWSLALWRYLPSSSQEKKKKQRNHPLLLLSGIATNAIGYDLSPECSFARYMSGNGFDTWVLELRGSGLSTIELDLPKVEKHPLNSASENERSVDNGTNGAHSRKYPSLNGHSFVESDHGGINVTMDKLQLMKTLSDTVTPMPKTLSSFLSKGVLPGQSSAIASQIMDRKQLVNIFKQNQRIVPTNILGLQENILTTFEEFQRQFELIFKYDWDFDNFLEEDLPAAMEYIRTQCKPEDGKLHAIGHSMGGILLYSRLSHFCSRGTDSGLASVTTLASSLDYSTSRSSLKLLLPLADPARALNVPAIPVGAILATLHPFVSSPPYLLNWLRGQISAHGMMQPELYEKLLLKNFCTIPAKLLLQLASAFYKGGLRNRNGDFNYIDHLHKINVPVLAIGGDQDQICPPEAVYETVKHIPSDMVTLKILGKPGGPHYGHYDVVGSHLAPEQVYPHIIDFLMRHDSQKC